MRALITGATGQDGYYLIKELSDYEVFALYRGQDELRLRDLKVEHPGVTWVRGDVTDPASINSAVALAKPDAVFNLAALSFVGLSWEMPHLYMETNAGGLLNVLEAVRKVKPDAHVVQASSSEMYGNEQMPAAGFNENSPMVPVSPYGVSKLAAHRLCRVYRESFGMRVSSAISFNHESPRRPPVFVTRKIVQAAVEIARGERTEFSLGNVSARRDWGYAGDFVRAYRLMAEQDHGDDFVVGTGEMHSVEELATTVFAKLKLAPWTDFAEESEQDLRPNDLNALLSDPSKIDAVLGWRATTSFDELIDMMLYAEAGARFAEPEVVPV